MIKWHRRLWVIAASFLVGAPASANAINCESIVEATVAEVKVGAAGWWTEDTQRMAGMAAMTACFKAAAALATQAADADAPVQDQTANNTATGAPAASGSDNESSGFVIRPLGGVVSKKPYERARGK